MNPWDCSLTSVAYGLLQPTVATLFDPLEMLKAAKREPLELKKPRRGEVGHGFFNEFAGTNKADVYNYTSALTFLKKFLQKA